MAPSGGEGDLCPSYFGPFSEQGEGYRQAARRKSLREAVLKVERRWGIRASGRLFAGRYTPSPGLATGLPELDAATGFEGLPCGKLTELTGGSSSGKLTLALRALTTAMNGGGVAAYIDLPRQFYPPAAAAVGIDLRRLAVVRPDDAKGALRAASNLLNSEGFDAVLLDMADQDAHPNILARLAGLAGRAAASCIVTTERGLMGLRFYSSLRLGVVRRGWLWHEGAMGLAPAGMRLQVNVLKSRSTAGLRRLVVDCPFIGRQVEEEDGLRTHTAFPDITGNQRASGVAVAVASHLRAAS
ncbi:MAG: hypothetical protein OXG11_08790 [Chloroflexi bacterium]|nr:hypothetical protein [Chloroflexota bacterium]